MKNILKLIFLIALLLKCLVLSAQQDPLYGLYMNNPLTINPAYSGIHNNLMASMSFRNQWGGFEGNPTTFAASGHTSLRNNTMGAGIILLNDRIGEISNTNINASYAYKINLKDKVFSFGMLAGLMNYQTDPGKLNLSDPDDPAFGRFNETKFNLGAGTILKSDQYLIGLSVPHMLSSSVETSDGAVKVYQQHLYLFGSYAHFVNERILFKPSVLMKAVGGAPMSIDVNLNVNIDRHYGLGIFTRNLNSYGFQAQLAFKEKYRMAYLFEVPGNATIGTRFLTHEIMLSINTAIFNFHEDWNSNF